ncbi:MAG: Fluoride ion transporter CrcB [uncultured Pseudonocardia sp.]|uniref:Fluoride-specific ion channel FluC n=1 Tax=uncultured Pseudonocardia sp. TaxID=211455 RepID=A0A6J4QAZ7_9PSEU|nr:MAG: Fluoride ion transporter CrcB [uncultured Pseudonocardia sp.]
MIGWVLLGGAAGAVVRHLVGRWLNRDGAPWGTAAVNVAGSFLLGAVLSAAGPAVVALVGTGFCGALTTYSTFALETAELPRRRAVVYAVGSVVLGPAAAALGAAAVS